MATQSNHQAGPLSSMSSRCMARRQLGQRANSDDLNELSWALASCLGRESPRLAAPSQDKFVVAKLVVLAFIGANLVSGTRRAKRGDGAGIETTEGSQQDGASEMATGRERWRRRDRTRSPPGLHLAFGQERCSLRTHRSPRGPVSRSREGVVRTCSCQQSRTYGSVDGAGDETTASRWER